MVLYLNDSNKEQSKTIALDIANAINGDLDSKKKVYLLHKEAKNSGLLLKTKEDKFELLIKELISSDSEFLKLLLGNIELRNIQSHKSPKVVENIILGKALERSKYIPLRNKVYVRSTSKPFKIKIEPYNFDNSIKELDATYSILRNILDTKYSNILKNEIVLENPEIVGEYLLIEERIFGVINTLFKGYSSYDFKYKDIDIEEVKISLDNPLSDINTLFDYYVMLNYYNRDSFKPESNLLNDSLEKTALYLKGLILRNEDLKKLKNTNLKVLLTSLYNRFEPNKAYYHSQINKIDLVLIDKEIRDSLMKTISVEDPKKSDIYLSLNDLSLILSRLEV